MVKGLDRTEIINGLISSHEDIFRGAFVSKKPTDKEIEQAEMQLGLLIPESYKWYLKHVGHGGFYFEIMGFSLHSKPLFAEKMLEQREHGLPNHLLIIQDMDEYYDCIDVSTDMVVTWSPYDQNGVIETGKDFLDYVISELKNAIEN